MSPVAERSQSPERTSRSTCADLCWPALRVTVVVSSARLAAEAPPSPAGAAAAWLGWLPPVGPADPVVPHAASAGAAQLPPRAPTWSAGGAAMVTGWPHLV